MLSVRKKPLNSRVKGPAWPAPHRPPLFNNVKLTLRRCLHSLDYCGNPSGNARRARKRSSGDSPGDGQTLRSSGRQSTVRVKRTNNPPPGQVSCRARARSPGHRLTSRPLPRLYDWSLVFMADNDIWVFRKSKLTLWANLLSCQRLFRGMFILRITHHVFPSFIRHLVYLLFEIR